MNNSPIRQDSDGGGNGNKVANQAKQNGLKPSSDTRFDDIMAEINEMTEYARSEGLLIPDAVGKQLADLCYGKAEEAEKLKDAPGTTNATKFALALGVHGALCKLIAPATPISLRATSRPDGRWKEQWAVKLLLYTSILCLLGFLVVAAWDKVESDANTLKLLAISMLVAASGLGSSFYGLYTANKYIVERRYDPKYNQVYFVRFVLGLTSGTILGYFGQNLMGSSAGDVARKFTPPILALLGGYSAEAVSQILQRVADTLVTMVRGSNDDVVKAKSDAAESKAQQKLVEAKTALAKPLEAAKAKAEGHSTQAEVLSEIQKAMDLISK